MITIDWLPMPPKNINKEGDDTATNNAPRYYPRINHSQTLSDEDLFKYAESQNKRWDDYILRAAFDIVSEALAKQLCQGNAVSFPNLGTFRLQITTDQEVTASKRTQTKHVHITGIHFTPSKEFLIDIGTPQFRWQPDSPSASHPTDAQIMQKITEWFRSHDTITRQEISTLLSIKRTAATSLINRLIKQGHFTKSGSGHNTNYTLII